MLKNAWWKVATVILLYYVLIMGLLGKVPRLPILNETVRNLYFHVPMWFGMIILFGASVFFAVRYLNSGLLKFDRLSASLAEIGIVFGLLGMVTGMLWARFTWGEFWSSDPKQNASAIGLMIYFGYLLLRGSVAGVKDRARLSSVYSIFAFAILIPLIYVLPRFTDSLHPGNGGNPGFNPYDQARYMRPVFYPSVLAWTLLGVWMANLLNRYKTLKNNILIKSGL